MSWPTPQMALPGQQYGQPPNMAGAVPNQQPTTVNGQMVDGSGRPVQAYGMPQPQWNPGMQPQPQPVTQPHPTLGYLGDPNQPQPVPQAQPQQQPRPQFSGAEVLDGPGIPTELRGRRISDVMNLYGRLIDFYAKNKEQGQGAAPQGGGQPVQPGQPQNQGQGQQLPPPQTPTQQTPFANAMRQMIQETVKEVVSPMVAPIQQQSLQQGIREAEDAARRTIPDFQMIEGELRQILSSADPQHLANPEFWEASADLARGRYYRNQSMQQGGYPQPQPQPTPMSQYSAPYQTNGLIPQPPQQHYFTESPTPPSVHPQAAGFTSYEMEAMKGMGISPQEWAAWKAPIDMSGAGSRQLMRRY